MWIYTALVLALVKSSHEACDVFKKTVNIFTVERILYRYILCTEITPNYDLRNDIVSKMNSSSQYIEVSNSSIPEITQDLFLSVNLTELKIYAGVEIVQESAFENANISSIILENNQIKKIKGRSFNSSSIYVISLQNNSLSDILSNSFIGVINLRKLNLRNNQIVYIQAGAFSDLGSLEELNLAFNKLNSIPSGLFKGLKRLQTIYLNDNFLKTLSRDAFSECKILQYLNVQSNYLSGIDAALYPDSLLFINASNNRLSSFNFSNLINVDTVDLTRNTLTKSKDCLNNMPTLKFLHLNYNSMGPIVNDSFQHLPNLTIIEIDGNNLQQFDFKIFNNMAKLKGISLAENTLTNIDFSGFITQLKLLNLSGNSLSELKNLTILKDLIKLELSINNFQAIKYDMFAQMYNLKNLWLDHNSIKTLDLGCFRDLKTLVELNLSYNKITNLYPGIFTGLKEILQLDISHNNLSNFDEDIFHNTKHLTFLNLAYNNLNNSNIKRMLSHLSWLREINLNGNNWSCISLINIVRETKYVGLTPGKSFNISNVYGIACNDTDDGVPFDKTNYLIDMSKLVNATSSNTKDVSYKMSVNNALFVILLFLLCAKVVYDKYSAHVVAAKQFVYKKTASEQEIQLI